jgi:hypothetical protein
MKSRHGSFVSGGTESSQTRPWREQDTNFWFRARGPTALSIEKATEDAARRAVDFTVARTDPGGADTATDCVAARDTDRSRILHTSLRRQRY